MIAIIARYPTPIPNSYSLIVCAAAMLSGRRGDFNLIQAAI